MFIQPLYGKYPLIDDGYKRDSVCINRPFKINFNPRLKSKRESPLFYFCKTSFQEHTCYGLIAQVNGFYPPKKLYKHEECFSYKITEFCTEFEKNNVQLSPTLLFHENNPDFDAYFKSIIVGAPSDIIAYGRECTYEIWPIEPEESIMLFFNNINNLYVADGHHRISSLFSSKSNVLAYIVQTKYLKNYPIIREYNSCCSELANFVLRQIKERFDIQLMGFNKNFSENFNCPILSIGLESFIISNIEGNKNNFQEFLKIISLMSTINNFDICFTNYQANKINCDRFKKMSIAERKSRVLLYIPQIDIEKYIEGSNLLLPPHSSWFEPKIPPGIISMEINRY